MEYPLDDVLSAISLKTKLIVISDPNNLTWTLLSQQDVLKIAKAAPKACILVDEFYYEFCDKTVKDNIDEYANIVITRTFLKTWYMASFRIGYLISKSMLEDFFLSKSIKYFPSAANFYLIEAGIILYDFLKDKGILVRPRWDKYIRISLSTKEKTEQLINKLEEYYSELQITNN